VQRSFLLVSCLAVAACGDDGGNPDNPDADPGAPDAGPPDAAIPADVEMRTLTLAPGGSAEGVFEAGPDDRVRILLSAATPTIAWNIHGHVGGETQTIVMEDDVMMVDYWYEPESQTDWFLQPVNSGNVTLMIDVTIELYAGATFIEWLE
jgi:hypothetical protein